MTINPFKLERFFARYEFNVKYLLSSSDCEGLLLSELLEMASPESLKLWQNLKLSYTESAGHPLLRTEISSGYTQTSADNVLVAVPEEAIFVAMHSLLKAGDHVIAVAPAYQSLHEIAISLGCSLTKWELTPSPQGWSLDLDFLEDNLTDETRLLVLNFPNNPTGYLPTADLFEAIVALARKHGVTVFCDEMYRLLESDPALRLPSICEVYEKGIALSGLSKTYALPGLRVGWLVSSDSTFLEDCLKVKDYTTICHSAPSEILAIIALQNTARIVARNLEIIAENTRLAGQFFRKHADLVAWSDPQGGSIAFPEWLGTGTVDEFCEAVLDEQGVMIVPGSIFDYPGSRFRIGLGRKNFGEALEHLDEFLSPRG